MHDHSSHDRELITAIPRLDKAAAFDACSWVWDQGVLIAYANQMLPDVAPFTEIAAG
jgi:hypothetical protein